MPDTTLASMGEAEKNAAPFVDDHDQPGSPTSEEPEKTPAAPANPWMDPSSFPEGGAKAWLTVAGAAACLFVSFGWINCIGVFQDYYQTHQLRDYTPSDIAWIPALQVFCMRIRP